MPRKYSPHPWHISASYTDEHERQITIDDSNHTIVARLEIWKGKAVPEMDANASLLQAAPDLLAALEDVTVSLGLYMIHYDGEEAAKQSETIKRSIAIQKQARGE